jgi:hypothetical protein
MSELVTGELAVEVSYRSVCQPLYIVAVCTLPASFEFEVSVRGRKQDIVVNSGQAICGQWAVQPRLPLPWAFDLSIGRAFTHGFSAVRALCKSNILLMGREAVSNTTVSLYAMPTDSLRV